jgi:hypothetical protein
MSRITIGFTACLAAAITAGCGTVKASQPPAGGHTAAPGTTPSASPPPGPCQGSATAGQTLLITTASNGKTYCVRVGEQVDVQLRGSVSSMWLEPLASSNVLTPVPNGELSLVAGLTEEFFAAARPGQVLITSVRPPCQFGIPQWKMGGGIEPANPVPKTYPLRFCAPAHRLSVSILVTA